MPALSLDTTSHLELPEVINDQTTVDWFDPVKSQIRYGADEAPAAYKVYFGDKRYPERSIGLPVGQSWASKVHNGTDVVSYNPDSHLSAPFKVPPSVIQ
jgi:hypothetical protein